MLHLLTNRPGSSHESVGQAWRPSASISLPEEHRAKLDRWVRSSTTPQRLAVRSLIVLLAGSGMTDAAIAGQMHITRRTAARWRLRYVAGGPDALTVDAPGRGRKPGRNPEVVAKIVEATAGGPPAGLGRWTVRSLARHLGVSHATVQRVWKERGITPHVAS